MKIMIIRIIGIFFLHIYSNAIFSQELKRGDLFPSITFDNVLNYQDSKINLKDFEGKLVILDFWGFNCTSCLESFPKLELLQAKFKDKVQIVLINKDSKTKTNEFFEKRKKRLSMPKDIPFITSDTLLKKYFPHGGVPYLVWINSEDRVCSINSTIDEVSLTNYLTKGELPTAIAYKHKFVKSFFDKQFEPYVEYATYFSKGIDTLKAYIDDGKDHVAYSPHSILDLFQFAYNESFNDSFFGFRDHGRTILKVRDETKYKLLPGVNFEEWRGKYGYYYHAILPEYLETKRYKIMQEDLHRYFNLTAKVEKRKVKCLTLTRTSKIDKLKTKGGEPALTLFSIEVNSADDNPVFGPVRYLRNQPFEKLRRQIENFCSYHFKVMFADSTYYKGNIDFEMKESELNQMTLHDLRRILRKYDLDLIEKEVLLDVLVLAER